MALLSKERLQELYDEVMFGNYTLFEGLVEVAKEQDKKTKEDLGLDG